MREFIRRVRKKCQIKIETKNKVRTCVNTFTFRKKI